MAPLTFGTDGVRGLANAELTPELAMALGRAVARALPATTLLVGRDTRRSSAMLAAALAAGAASEGAEVTDLGVLPTPGVAALCAKRRAPGVVVSASHNPFADNGIKVLDVGGVKLDAATEARIEAELSRLWAGSEVSPRPTGRAIGVVRTDGSARASYVAALREAADVTSLSGLKIVVDCANGAASGLAPEVLRGLGASVTSIGDEPDGCNINDKVGTTSPEALVDAVLAVGADLGLSLDGDADRCVAVDATGAILDGDWLLALFATQRRQRGTLDGGVVVTVMTNLGFHRAMRDAGIPVVEVPVGDRHVLEALARTGWVLGGEQSGHVVFADRATTGDGLLTGILLAQLVATRGPLHALVDGLLVTIPQLLVNVEVVDASALDGADEVWLAVERHRVELGERGRVVLRASGTESLVRIMVEAEDDGDAHRIADSLHALVLSTLGTPGAQD
ncbi:MAG TPA: phosphoglucosamine mutase [Acidimicrobiales bacterium]